MRDNFLILCVVVGSSTRKSGKTPSPLSHPFLTPLYYPSAEVSNTGVEYCAYSSGSMLFGE